jgi:hypothetical protein
MPRQDHEARYPDSLQAVFMALNRVLGKHRWAVTGQLDEADALPKAGCRYARNRKSVLRRGRVSEVIRPVSLTLHETLYDPPCRVRLQLRFRVHSLAAESLLHLALSYQLNGAASMRSRHWHRRLQEHCARMLQFVAKELVRSRQAATTCSTSRDSQASVICLTSDSP